MAGKFSSKGLIKGLPFCILAALALLLVLLAGTPFDRKPSSTSSRLAGDAGKTQPHDPGVSAATARPPVSQGDADLQKKDPSDKKHSRIKLATKNNRLPFKASGAYQADETSGYLPAAEEAGFFEEESPAGSEGTLYSEAQLNEFDTETLRLIDEEIRLAQEYQPEDEAELELDQEELEYSLAEDAQAFEEERRLYPEGRLYSDAQLDEFDPETISIVEEEIRQASEKDN